MASQKLTDLAAISTPATADVLYIIDSSDTSDNASGSSRRINFGSLIESSTITLTNKTLTSPTINSPVLSSIQVQDTSADHQYVFAVSELVADRIVTLPLLTGNDEFVFKDFTQTLTNKRITKRIASTASSATPTPNADTTDEYILTALGAAAEFAVPSGTPTQGQSLVIRIKDDGTGRALTYNAIYRAIGITLPTTTVANKTTYIGAFYNSTDTKWDCMATGTE